MLSRSDSRSLIFGVCLLTFSLFSAVLLLAGCEGEKGKKAALTDEEIQQRAFAPKPQRPDTIRVSGEIITADDILTEQVGRETSGGTFKDKLMELARATTYEQFREAARPQLRDRLNNNITTIVLYKRARRELGEDNQEKVDETLDKLTDKELRRFVFEHGGDDAQADEALKKKGWTRATYRELVKKEMLARYALKLQQDQPITYGELVTCYDKMKDESFVVPASVQFSLIDISPGKVEVTDPNENRAEKARVLSETLIRRIRAGEDFATLAKQYSDDLRKEAGGLWPARDPNSFTSPYDGLAKKAMQMQPGQVAGPIEVPGYCFILKLEQKQEKSYRLLQEVQDRVERTIEDDRYDEAMHQFDVEIAAETAMVDTDAFLDRCLEKLHKEARAPQR